MSLINDLSQLGEESNYEVNKPVYPKGFEPGIEWDGIQGTITTGPLTQAPNDWFEILKIWGLPTDGSVTVIEPIQMRAWDSQTKDGVQRMFYYRASVVSSKSRINSDELVAEITRWKPLKRQNLGVTGVSYVVAYADTQIGKMDGDGTAGTIDRVLHKTDMAIQRLKELRKSGRKIESIYLPQLGDCIEGFNSQGGKNGWRNDLDLTSQIRVYRRLLLHIVKEFAPLADKIIVPCVPGNHDEAVRIGNQMATTYTDSFALDAASAVAEALQISSDYEHVSFVFPKFDTLTVTLDVSGVITGFAHGHQTRGKAQDWWAKQAHGKTEIGDSTLLLTGHYHHLRVEQTGVKTWIQMPSLDGGSQWFVERTGCAAPAGLVTMCVGNGQFSDLAIL
jgi:predicted phosphodiesterase